MSNLNKFISRISDMKYRFETLKDARKFAFTKIKQGYNVKQAISVVEMPVDLDLAAHVDYPVQTKRYYVVKVVGDEVDL